MHAALAAYSSCGEWLQELRRVLTGNRDFLLDYLDKYLPEIKSTRPEATYLAWLDCRDCGIDGNPQKFFLNQARVALNDGKAFGEGGDGFVRLNYGCSRDNLAEALERMGKALGRN